MQSRSKAQAAALLASPEDTEQQFYEALQQADLDRLMEVWADEEEISCVHPGGPRVVGLGAIRAAFETVFLQGAIPAHPERVRYDPRGLRRGAGDVVAGRGGARDETERDGT